MAKLIDGKKISEVIKHNLKEEIAKWVSDNNSKPKLATILIGTNASQSPYTRNIISTSEYVGIKVIVKELSSDTTEAELLNEIDILNNDISVNGILIQLPLPKGINEQNIYKRIKPEKDVEGLNVVNYGRLCLNLNCFIPCTALAVQTILQQENVLTKGKNTVVVGASKAVGLPVAILLHSDVNYELPGMCSTVTICHVHTPPEQLKSYCQSADILITATGVPNLIQADMVKPGACVIDVGFTRIKDEKTGEIKFVGDVNFDDVKNIAGMITPVPGGVGPMTVVMLMKNTFKAAKNME